MGEVKRYADAMIRGDIAVCESIEKQYNVYGYPPEIVSVMLSMIDAVKERDQLRTELDEAKQGQRVLAHELEAARAEIERLKVANAALERL